MQELTTITCRQVDNVFVAHMCLEKYVEDGVIGDLKIDLLYDLLPNTGENPCILISFDSVDFVSSAALGIFMTLDKKVKARNGRLVLCAIRPEIYEVFAITRLNKLFEIAEDEEDGLATIHAPRRMELIQ